MFRSSLDRGAVEEATSWRVVSRRVAASTNDLARAAIEEGIRGRWVGVADRQTAGRGRLGRSFASPSGGLYASAVVSVPEGLLPAPLVGVAAVSLAEAIEASAPGLVVRVKWPNDLWIGTRKVGGILVEAAGGASPEIPVVVGVGVNLRAVPADLPPEVAREVTALDLHAPAPVAREDLLREWLPRLEAGIERARSPGGLAALADSYRSRAALVGERVRFVVGGGGGDRREEGVLQEVSLLRGLLVQGASGAPVWHSLAHVSDVRSAEPPPP